MRKRWSGWLAGLGVCLVAVGSATVQAATITVEAVGRISVCFDDVPGTLAALAALPGGGCTGARVALKQSFEVGPNSSVDAVSDPSVSSFGDAISTEIKFLDSLSLLSASTGLGTGFGVMSIQTHSPPSTPASFSSTASQALAPDAVLFTQMQFSGLADLLTSADPNLAVIDLSTVPSGFDISFGATLQVALDPDNPFDRIDWWSFTAVAADVESMRFVRDPGLLPEPASGALLLLALAAAAMGSRRRDPKSPAT